MNPSWNGPPAELLLPTEAVHIWRAGLDLPSKSVQEFKKILSSDESARADNYRFERDRNKFIAARGILRLILACYLNVEPGSIEFYYEKSGKPKLQDACCKTGIQFNLSHSEGLALYAFARGRGVGIDIEYMREISEMELIVEQFFSVRERAFFAKLPTDEKQETFFVWWTRKEAFMKAVGEGLSHPLWKFDTLLAEGKSVDSPGRLKGAKEGPKWAMWDVSPAEEFAGAVVVEGKGSNVQCWQWPG